MLDNHYRKHSVYPFWITLCCLVTITTNPSQAQIIPDGTLPTNSSITTQNNVSTITGGTVAGQNLFHSFKEFSVVKGSTAYFKNDGVIQNIISRVTGESVSNIDGLIKANNANLFLLNPNGIIFGPNASLDIGGSFLATTASSLKFADGTEFSAKVPQTTPLLTVSVPIGLQFGKDVGRIVNQSVAVDNSDTYVGLQVQPGRTLALIGGDVALEGGNLTAAEGRIELGSVAASNLVSLTPTAQGFILGYQGVQNFQDIQLSQGSVVDTTGNRGGDIQVQGRRVALSDGSLIQTFTKGSSAGGALTVNASDSVVLSGFITTPDGQFGSALFTGTEATGSAGDLTITTGKLVVQKGAYVLSDTHGEGKGGNLAVNASQSVELIGTTDDGNYPSALSTTAWEDATGAGGNLTLQTERLIVKNGAQIQATTYGKGNGGTLTVGASDLVELSGTASDSKSPSGLLTTVQKGARGAGGNLTLNTRQLIVRDGAQIQAATLGRGTAGYLEVNASEAVYLIGESDKHEPSGLFTVVEGDARGVGGNLTLKTGRLIVQNGAQISSKTDGIGPAGKMDITTTELVELRGKSAVNRPSILTAQTKGAGPAGNLTIHTGQLIIQDGGQVIVSSLNKNQDAGTTGNLTVTARSILLDNQGKLVAESNSVQGGDITLKLQDLLLLRHGSSISTSAGKDQGGGDGGNITINAPNGFIVATPGGNSDITANAFSGQGGRVTINATGIFGMVQRSREELQQLLGTTDPTKLDPSLRPTNDITAISQTNPSLNGVVTINTPDIDPNRGLVQLPVEPVNVQVAQGCQAAGTQTAGKQSSLASTGKGGLAINPYEPLSSSNIWEDVPASTQTGTSRQRETVATVPDKIVEAQGWVINEKGEVFLVAEDSRCSLR